MADLTKPPALKAAVVFPEIINQYLCVSAENRLAEAVGLALAINLNVVWQQIVKLRNVKPATLFGQGILEKFKADILAAGAELLIVDSSLSPIQQRNLEKFFNLKVIDRTALILEIFGERAHTSEGKLQVELAHLSYQRSRLVRSWTHLERQRGGAGFLGGPGETQIELDRRLIDEKIVRIKKDLEKVRRTRQIQRQARQRVPYPVVALVGYTNAGKSSLFNRLTDSSVLAQDMLFATLDTALRKLELPSGRTVILSDTVGFISDLPHELIMAFRATLEEVLEADIIVHVRDASNVETREQQREVLKVLAGLGLDNLKEDLRYIEVLNKIDLVPSAKRAVMAQKEKALVISALTGEGCAEFKKLLDERLAVGYEVYAFSVAAHNGRLQAWIYTHTEVLSVTNDEDKVLFKVRLATSAAAKLKKYLASQEQN